VKSSAHAIITKINHRENAIHAIIFFNPNGIPSKPVLAVIEKIAHNQI
jgi:hypothetical protein